MATRDRVHCTRTRLRTSTFIMQPLQWFSVIVFGLLVSAQQSPPKELEIKTTYTPSDCTVKAQNGDAIMVHYVRRPIERLRVLVYGC
jgi:hypothetical protein